MAKPILLYTSIFSDTAIDFTTQVLDAPKNEKLKIWINTPGGSVSSGFAMLAAVQEHESDNEMTVTGNADSFGFFMLLFGDHNKAYDTSNFLIHRAASFWEDFMTTEELKDIENINKTIRRKLEARIDEDVFEKVTKKTFDDIFDMETRLDVRLTARQAKKIGLIHEVVKLDVAKKAEIESRYFNDIAALATPQKKENSNNNNSNSNKMSKLTDLIFGEKDSVLIASIGETQFAYSKIEKGAKIKAVGKGEHDPISGTFEADEKQITVIDNEITAIEDIDTRKKEIEALKTEISEMKTQLVEALKKPDPKKPESNEDIEALKTEILAMKKIIADAKLNVSDPDLPEGEFLNDAPDEDLTVREKLIMAQNKAHEKKLKSREA